MRKSLRKAIALLWTTDSIAEFETAYPVPTKFWFCSREATGKIASSERFMFSKSIGTPIVLATMSRN